MKYMATTKSLSTTTSLDSPEDGGRMLNPLANLADFLTERLASAVFVYIVDKKDI